MAERSDDIFTKERLLKIWQAERETRNYNTTLVWENVKFFVSLIGGLLTAHSVLLGLFLNVASYDTLTWFGVKSNVFGLGLLVFPAAIFILSYCGWRDLKMRWERFLLVVTHLLKLEDLLGIHEDIGDKVTQMKKGEQYKRLFPDYYHNFLNYDSYEKFREEEMKKRNTYTSMRYVYSLINIPAVLLVVVDIGIFYPK